MQRKNKDIIGALFRDIGKQLQSLDDLQFEELLSGDARLEVRLISTKKGRTQKEKTEVPTVSSEEMAEELHKIGSREEGYRYLKTHCNTKDNLFILAKQLDLPVLKKDKIDHIKEKIIESTIGFRIRSAAIQGPSKEKLSSY